MRTTVLALFLLFASGVHAASADEPEGRKAEVPVPTLSSDGRSAAASSTSVAQLANRIARLEKKLAAIEHHLSTESKQATPGGGIGPSGNSKRAKRDATESVEQPTLAPNSPPLPHASKPKRQDSAGTEAATGEQESRPKPKATRNATKSVEQPTLAPSSPPLPHASTPKRQDSAGTKAATGEQESRPKPKAILLNEKTIGRWQRVTLNGEEFYLLPVADTNYTDENSTD